LICERINRFTREDALDEDCAVPFVRLLLLSVGVIATLVGLIWIGQGTGYFPYPSSSFMINEMPWAYRGAVLAILGLVALAISRTIGRR
jgi:hypothetical protein